jgi:outer membrane receptor for ferrienterochelin and colicin
MKKLIFLLLVISLAFCTASIGQQTIRGKVTDVSGETLIGVAIVLKANRSVGSITDLDGNYSFKIADTTAQTLIVTYVGYQVIEETVPPGKGGVTIRNFVLKSSSQEIKEVEVTAKVIKAREYFTENMKKNSAVSLDYISSETLKKTGDINVTSAIARVAGVSTNGSFITVRGIGDRYVKTGINGMRIPTLDPFTNNIKLDLFPASLVDNIIITKTASPDLPGDWAGAYISVETKDYPEELSVNAETSIGYNSQSTFKDVISSQRSSTDWLGYDNSLRDRNHNDFSLAIMSPSQYQQFVALGLGSYYNSMGVTNDNWTNNSDTYFRLGLVQLGLLPPALINDNTAYQNAVAAYNNGTYKGQAFNIVNAPAAKTGQSFPNTWNIVTRKAPLDFSQSFSIGNQTKLFGKPLGFLFGFRYQSSLFYDPNSVAERIKPGATPDSYIIDVHKDQQESKETNGWSGLINTSYKFNPNNSISLLFMPNFTGVNNVRNAYEHDNNKTSTTLTQNYEERKQLVYQFKSEHYLPGSKIKIESNASYTNGTSNVPDLRNIEYKSSGTSDNITVDPTNDAADRIFRYLSDDLFDSKLSAEIPIRNIAGLIRKLKIGGAYQYDKQKRDQYWYHVTIGNNTSLPPYSSIDQVFDLSNFGITNNSIPYYYSLDEQPINHTFGHSEVIAGFAMVDYGITPKFRISGGVRVERADIYTDVFKYDSLGYSSDDARRYSGGTIATPGKLNELSYLPSANIIYKLRNDEQTPINLRFNYSQTVARPSIRELTVTKEFDYELQGNVQGNPDLKMVQISNYDLRLESYFKNGDNISLSPFYKDFKNHIELVQSDVYTWRNVDKSYVMGLELEGKKIITKQLDFTANITFVKSHTEFVRIRQEIVGGVPIIYYEDTVKRSMFGQAPYIINGILNYSMDSIGLNLTLSYNIQGERLVIASNNAAVPDIYELPRNSLDLKIIKKLGKHFSTTLTVRDILNAERNRSYKTGDTWSLYDKYHFGTIYVFSLIYKL